MRKNKTESTRASYSILALDDDPIMTSTLQAYFQRSGYHVDVEHEPYKAIEQVRQGSYDILLLDFLMTPICGDQVVSEIRKFNRDIFIILLTGHKSVAPPIKTIRELDIQGYYEKSDRFDQLELLVESCVKSISQMRTIQNYKNGLAAIVDSLPKIYNLQSLEHIMDSIIGTAVFLFDSPGGVMEIDLGIKTGASDGLTDSHLIRTLGTVQLPFALAELLAENSFADGSVIYREPWIMAAIHEKDRTMGLLSVKISSPPQNDKIQLLEVFSRQITAALSNVFLHAEVSLKNDELTHAYEDLRNSYLEIVDALRLMVDTRDNNTKGHSDRVADFAVEIAKALGKDREYCDNLRIAGMFHDIGKVGVPDNVLMKAASLSTDEYGIIKKHPQDGARILTAITLLRDIVPIVLAHHERIDGKGYPRGLMGDEIPEQSRIIAVADSFDAMISDRAYRKALSFDAAVEQVKLGRGTQFDPVVADAFLSIAPDLTL